MRKRTGIIFIALTGLLLSISHVLAQAGSFTFVNESNVTIDQTIVEQAAQVLIDKYSADVAVYAVISGDAADFRSRLLDAGLVAGIDTNQRRTLAIYFAVEEQYSEIRWGAAFDKIDGAGVRSDALNPSLRAEDFTGAVVNTLHAVDGQMSDPLIGIRRLVGELLSSVTFWVFAGAAVLFYILKKLGITGRGGSGSSTVYHDTSSSWSSGDSGGSSGSGGGSSGGSWND